MKINSTNRDWARRRNEQIPESNSEDRVTNIIIVVEEVDKQQYNLQK